VVESPPTPPISTFVVRMWHEWSVDGSRWRGRIEHLQSGESAAFLDLEGALAFIRRFTALPDQAGQPAKKNG
jgi:hypothetical protein